MRVVIDMGIVCDTEDQDKYLREAIERIVNEKHTDSDLELVCKTFKSRYDAHNMLVAKVRQ